MTPRRIANKLRQTANTAKNQRKATSSSILKSDHNAVQKPFNTTITKTCLYNFDSLKPHFLYRITGDYRGIHVHYFPYFCLKHRLWVLVSLEPPRRGGSNAYNNLCFEQKYEKYHFFYLKTFSFSW